MKCTACFFSPVLMWLLQKFLIALQSHQTPPCFPSSPPPISLGNAPCCSEMEAQLSPWTCLLDPSVLLCKGFGKQQNRTHSPICMCVLSVPQSCPTLSTPWTVTHQIPLSMGLSREEYWSGCHSLSRLHAPAFTDTTIHNPWLFG